MRRFFVIGMVTSILLIGGCSKGELTPGEPGDRAGPFAKSDLTTKRVVRRMSQGLKLHHNRPYFGRRIGPTRKIFNAKTKDYGLEVGVRYGKKTGDFKVYKVASEASRRRVLEGYNRIERGQSERMKRPYLWCYTLRKDLLLDCKMIPSEQQADIKRRFEKAVK